MGEIFRVGILLYRAADWLMQWNIPNFPWKFPPTIHGKIGLLFRVFTGSENVWKFWPSQVINRIYSGVDWTPMPTVPSPKPSSFGGSHHLNSPLLEFPITWSFLFTLPRNPPCGSYISFSGNILFRKFWSPITSPYLWPQSLPNWEGLAMALSPCLGS